MFPKFSLKEINHMKKINVMIMALMATAAGALSAHEPVAAKTEASCSSLGAEEQAFAAKLSDRQKKLFCMMNADQRKAAMTAAADPTLTADGAIDKVLKEQHVSALSAEHNAK